MKGLGDNMSLLNTKVLPALSGLREATVKSFKEIENDKGGYVETVLALPDREYKYIIFPTQVDYVTSALRTQFEMQDEEVTLEDMLIKAETTTIKVWFAYNQDLGRMNVAFHEPRVQEVAVEL